MAQKRDRDWIYHFVASSGAGSVSPSWPELARDPLEKLLLRPEQGRPNLRVGERLAERPLRAEDRPAWVPPLVGECAGNSYQLAAALSVLAFDAGRSLPVGLLSSGCVNWDTGELTPISELAEKLALALGSGANLDTPQRVAEAWDRGGPQLQGVPSERRVRPGSVRLFVTSGEGIPLRASLGRGFEFEPLMNLRLEELAEWSTEQLERVAGEGLILAQVRHLSQAARLVNLDSSRCYPVVATNVPCEIGIVRPRVGFRHYRYVDRRSDALHEVYADRLEGEGVRFNQPGEWRLKLARAVVVLRAVIQRYLPVGTTCFSVDVAVKGEEDGWLDMIAGDGVESIPIHYSCRIGITGTVMRKGIRQVFGNTADSDDYKRAISPDNPAADRYPGTGYHTYLEHLLKIKACIKLPIFDSHDNTVGVVAFHVDRPTSFPSHLVETLEKLVEWWVRPAVGEMRMQNVPELKKRPNPFDYCDTPLTPASFAASEQLLRVNCLQLAGWAIRQIPGVTRACVRLLDEGGENLRLFALKGYSHATPPELTPLSGNSAAAEAVRTRKSVFIKETRLQYKLVNGAMIAKHYEPIEPEAGATASVLLRDGSNVMGVLSLDWESRELFPSALRDAIVDHVRDFALGLSDFLRAATFNGVKELCADRDLEPDQIYSRALTLLTRSVGAERLALYLREPNVGAFRNAAAVGHGSAWKPGADDAAIDWVVRKRERLELSDANDTLERAKFDTPDPLGSGPYSTRDPDAAGGRFPYLILPMIAGDEVIGALRLASVRSEYRFASKDGPYLAEVVSYLARYVLEYNRLRLPHEMSEAVQRLGKPQTPESLPVRIQEVFRSVFNGCHWAVRLCETTELLGTTVEVLANLSRSPDLRAGCPSVRPVDSPGLSAFLARESREIHSGHFLNPEEFRRAVRADEDPLVDAACRDYPTFWGQPLRDANSQLIGTIFVARRGQRRFSEPDLGMLRRFGATIGERLVTHEAEEFELVRQSLQSMNAEFTKPYRPKSDLAWEIADWLLPWMKRYLGAEEAGVLYQPPRSEVYVAHGWGGVPVPSASANPKLLAGRGFCGVSFPDRDSRLEEQFATILQRKPESLESRNRAVLEFDRGTDRPMYFWFLGLPGEFIRVSRLAKMVECFRNVRPNGWKIIA